MENKIKLCEREICSILAHLAFHIHPDIVSVVQERNRDEFDYFQDLFGDRIGVDDYLFDGSACVFPGTRRYVQNSLI